MTITLNTISTDPHRSLSGDRKALQERDAELTAASNARREHGDPGLIICFLAVVLSFRAAAKKRFAEQTRGTNGYAGQHVETLDQFIESSFQRYETFIRNEAIRAKRIADLSLKGGY